MWVRFKEAFDWSPPSANKSWSQTYQPSVQNVKKECGEAAIAAGKAEIAQDPREEEKASQK